MVKSPRSIHVLALIKPKTVPLDCFKDFDQRPCWEDISVDAGSLPSQAPAASVNLPSEDESDESRDECTTRPFYPDLLRPLFGTIVDDALKVGQGYFNFSQRAEKYFIGSVDGGQLDVGYSGSHNWFPRFKLQPLEHWSDNLEVGRHSASSRAWAAAENQIIELLRAKKMFLSPKYIDRIHHSLGKISVDLG